MQNCQHELMFISGVCVGGQVIFCWKLYGKNYMKLLTHLIHVLCWWLFRNALFYEERSSSGYLVHLLSNRNPPTSHIPSLIQYSQTSLAVMQDHSTDDLDKPNDSYQTLLSLASRISCLQFLEHLFLNLGIRTKNEALVHLRYKASRNYKNMLLKKKKKATFSAELFSSFPTHTQN